MQRTIVITGTDTSVGKTVFTAALAAHLHAQGTSVAAVKPLCSGGRADARALCQALGGTLTLDEINPEHFRAPVAPLLAARKEGRRVTLRQVVAHARRTGSRFDVLLLEGAGGLLSPLGEGFDTRDLIRALRAEVIIVARNQLGVINHVRLTLEALPAAAARTARIILMAPPHPTAASRDNASLLREFAGETPVIEFPWLPGGWSGRPQAQAAARQALQAALPRPAQS